MRDTLLFVVIAVSAWLAIMFIWPVLIAVAVRLGDITKPVPLWSRWQEFWRRWAFREGRKP